MITKKRDYLYVLFRVIVGLAFLQHGGQKLFGWFGGVGGDGIPVVLISLMGLAGVIELLGGALITLGLFTRPAAFIAAVEMLFALGMAHFSRSLFPIVNGGEPALLFFASFLVLLVHGPGKLALGNKFKK